ncbi:hypothetical protein GGI04_003608 [Coemansia thaxteri]|uniref:AB hydrolase-1 domain-containing protein n=1 Tax=Coemansia thaxteri TaxID=2663907 RepID=A0A9W8BFR4_9FUNG|nr:hypothetical protein GGI04_003608 [Coemansia thaxteri]KAJ2003856.1 hypothetical protein H4R26_002834 [Coemansia thaxteri]KAJ2484458.1 hypothetical protein EV174_002419 [Coemansia sp. RSA 2320]
MKVVRQIFSASRKGQGIVANIYSAAQALHREERKGLTLILAHANGFHKELWEPTLERVLFHQSKTWYINRAIALDSYNHGDSAVLNRSHVEGEDFSPWSENARDILSVISQLDDPQNIIGIGHSWGASSLLLAEIMSPRTFSALIITDPVLFSGSAKSAAGLAALTLKRRHQWSSAQEARQYFENHTFFRIWDKRVVDLHLKHGLEKEEASGLLTLKCRPANEAAVYLGSADDSPFTTQNLWKVACPVAFLTGEKSDQSPPAHIKAITKPMAECQHVVMDNMGHLLLLEDPDRTADWYIEFLDDFVSKPAVPTANL